MRGLSSIRPSGSTFGSLMLFRRNRRADGPTSPAALDNESEPHSGTDRLTAIASLSSALVRAKDKQAVARILIDTCLSLLAVDMAAVALVSEDMKRAQGLLAAGAEGELDWWTSVAVDFDSEPSGIASAVFAGGPVVVYDIASSQQVNRGLAERSGARSAVFVPLVSEERVPAVLVLATTQAPRAFTGDELSLIQALAAEAALAFDRASSADALADALQRERLVASIGRKVRSELDLDDVLRVAVESTGSATGVSRCFLRLGEPSNPMPIAAEWTAPGFTPIGDVADHLAVSNLAARDRRTVAVGDIREEPALDDAALGGTETLQELDSRAVLATPVLVFDRMIGIFGLHRSEPGAWSEAEIALAEAVARELGHRDPRGAAPPRERAAARTADGAPQCRSGGDERAPARDRPPAARRRGDEAARCRRGRLLPLRRGQLAPPLRGRPRPRSGARRLRAPRRALGRHSVRRARAAPCVSGVRERHRGTDDLVRRTARRARRRDARPGAALRRAREEPARDLRRSRVARGPQRGELRAERPPGAGATGLLRNRLRAVRAPLAVGDPRRGRGGGRTRRSVGRSRRC